MTKSKARSSKATWSLEPGAWRSLDRWEAEAWELPGPVHAQHVPFHVVADEALDDSQLEALKTAHEGARSQDAVAAALFDYAELSDRHRKEIDGRGGFEAPLIDEARTLGALLRELSAASLPAEGVQALELRNRLGTLLHDRMQRVRSAARFVFRREPALIRQVTSA